MSEPPIASHRPETVDELRAIVRAATQASEAVYPQGGATALDYGGIPARPGMAVGLDRLNRVIDYPVADMTITVEAGVTLGSIRQQVAEQNQRLAIEAPDPDRATLGGIFATAWTGPRRFGWGRPRDQIIGVGFVSADGELIRGGGRVVKNVAGYDFPKLLTGSLGTLGIITELTLKVSPRPEASAVVRVGFDSLGEAVAALDALNLSATRPVALELVGGAEQGAGWDLHVGFEGNNAAVAWQIARLQTELGRTNLPVERDGAAEDHWVRFVQDEADAPGVLGWRASFAPSAALTFLAGIDRSQWAIRAHAGNGVVRGRARSEGAGEADRAAWSGAIAPLRAEADRLGGALILDRCPSGWKGELSVWGPRRADWAVAERVKQALDPTATLNPGRFVGTI